MAVAVCQNHLFWAHWQAEAFSLCAQRGNAWVRQRVWHNRQYEPKLFFQNPDNRIMVADYTAKGDFFVTRKPHLWSDQQLHNLGGTLNYDLAPDWRGLVGAS
jgi:hypothetical protein